MFVVAFTAGATAAWKGVAAETLVDIVWANARPADRLEHLTARPASDVPGSLSLVMFLREGSDDGAEPAALGTLAVLLCRRAIAASPMLDGWTAAITPTRNMPDATPLRARCESEEGDHRPC